MIGGISAREQLDHAPSRDKTRNREEGVWKPRFKDLPYSEALIVPADRGFFSDFFVALFTI